ncbi:MAG: DNA repair protein RadC [Nitrospirae bacterium]|nr:DNA repair protein RadC [Nitrospirota bacterium]
MNKTSKPGCIGHRKRIKDKYKAGGLSGWHDYEVLELALSYAIPRKDTKPIAKELLSQFKTINGVLNADRKDLIEVFGVSEHSAMFLKFLRDMAVLYSEEEVYNKDLLSSPEVVYNYLKTSLKGASDEEFKTLFLNTRNRLLSVETIQKGTVNKSVVYPRKIVERALYNKASGVIIAHNHPGGSLNPSEDDHRVTKAIKDALRTVDISLLDHIIAGGNGYFSFKEQGMI